ncbi:hypothetical protein Lpp126_17069 [Lacticaseibacillus paracasei subsp. paracasei Lpp126]|uniref:Uncharacterized protein n=1 Tax=Lacticaseibacillus paracasei subsp. paracasei Lpp126 TaxID=1256206 RepID=S2RT70_LACPA|nr:hypothetical protein Lpp126_17069 [Lacticaseibacillus paracasei subsp. paracasei Lpp126]
MNFLAFFLGGNAAQITLIITIIVKQRFPRFTWILTIGALVILIVMLVFILFPPSRSPSLLRLLYHIDQRQGVGYLKIW